MKTIEITAENAKAAYKKADKAGKELLKTLLGENIFSGKIQDQVQSFEDACRILKINEDEILGGGETVDEAAYIKLKTIAKALNEGWVPDWKNNSEYKYYPWFNMNDASGFSFFGYDLGCTNARLGSRLCFKSRELAEYAGKQFTSIYKDFLTL